MARKKKHEEHTNHEAWAIPYGDLVTLLLALFVVLYSMSSVNEGKYRVLSDSLNAAFHGKPRASQPIQIGEKPQQGASQEKKINPIASMATASGSTNVNSNEQVVINRKQQGVDFGQIKSLVDRTETGGSVPTNLQRMAADVRRAMGDLIDKHLVNIRQTEFWLEIEIRADILFPSGVAQIANTANPILAHLAEIMKPFPNPIRIEGHTDNIPISTAAFPSNWQLSSARAANVVSLFVQQGVDPSRMSVEGFAEYHPAVANDTAEGRNRNRRVLIVVLGDNDASHIGRVSEALAADAENGGAAPGTQQSTTSSSGGTDNELKAPAQAAPQTTAAIQRPIVQPRGNAQ